MAKYEHQGSVHIFKKKKDPVWPWVVGVIIVLLIIGSADSESAKITEPTGVTAAYSSTSG